MSSTTTSSSLDVDVDVDVDDVPTTTATTWMGVVWKCDLFHVDDMVMKQWLTRIVVAMMVMTIIQIMSSTSASDGAGDAGERRRSRRRREKKNGGNRHDEDPFRRPGKRLMDDDDDDEKKTTIESNGTPMVMVYEDMAMSTSTSKSATTTMMTATTRTIESNTTKSIIKEEEEEEEADDDVDDDDNEMMMTKTETKKMETEEEEEEETKKTKKKEKKATPKATPRQRPQQPISSSLSSSPPPPPPPMKAKTSHHPGMDGFRRWYDAEASLYRMYTVGWNSPSSSSSSSSSSAAGGIQARREGPRPSHPPLPFVPRSERGHVPLKLVVTNDMGQSVKAYWIDYKGNEVCRGTIRPRSQFHQQTWIGHPWVFRLASEKRTIRNDNDGQNEDDDHDDNGRNASDTTYTSTSTSTSSQHRKQNEKGQLLCHYIPYRVIPTTLEVPTTENRKGHDDDQDDIDDDDDELLGLHRFTLRRRVENHDPVSYTLGHERQHHHRRHHPLDDANYDDDDDACRIDDPVFPVVLRTVEDAAEWTFHHMSRCSHHSYDAVAGARTLSKYLSNILAHPDQTKYRQIRIANPHFNQHVWNTPARGLLLALGFTDQSGQYAELGCSREALPPHRLRDVSRLLYHLEQWTSNQHRRRQQQENHTKQPQGADGYGRATFGRAGAMNRHR